MALLIDVYNDLVKEATEIETKEMLAERVEFLNKYADLATELLSAEFPNDYNKDDVIALADKLIERDMVISNEQEKQAQAQGAQPAQAPQAPAETPAEAPAQ